MEHPEPESLSLCKHCVSCGILWFLIVLIITCATSPFYYMPGQEELSDSSPKCDGVFQDPRNITFYRNKPIDPPVESYAVMEQTLLAEMPGLYNRFHTVIFDCPVHVASPSKKYSHYSYAFLKSLSAFNLFHKPPMKLWLRLHKRGDGNANFTFCTDLAVLGNRFFPGTITGVLGDSETLVAYATLQNTKSFLKNHQFPCKWYSEECFEILSAQHLKFGLIINPVDCQVFPRLVPHSVVRRFDEIFYFEGERARMTIGNDQVPTLSVSNDFNVCKNFVAEMVPDAKTVKYVIAEKYEVHQPWEISPYPYCLKFV